MNGVAGPTGAGGPSPTFDAEAPPAGPGRGLAPGGALASSPGPVEGPGAVEVPVAVIVPTYRRPQYLSEALASIDAQVGVRPREVIVVDDASHDGSADLARSLGARVIQKPVNEGLASARADGVEAAEGVEWVALLDDDDQWLPHHLSTVWAARDGHVMVSGASLSFGAGRPRYHGTVKKAAEVVASPARLLFPENSFTTSATLVRRDVLVQAGSFQRAMRQMEDLDLWLRALELGTGLLLPEVTCLYRRHANQLTASRSKMAASGAQIAAKYADRPWMDASARDRWRVVEVWDDLQSARAGKNWGAAWESGRWLLSHPRRPVALAQLWAFRRRVRGTQVPAAVWRRAEAQTDLTDG